VNKSFYFIILLVLTNMLFLSSCSLQKNRGRIKTDKNVKSEKKDIEFQYSFFEANKQKMLGNFNDAGAYYLKCIELKPNSAAANYEFASILSMGEDYIHAIKYAKKAYEIDPYNKWYQALLISLYKTNGELKKSSVLLEDMIKKHHDDYNSYLELTDIYLKMNQPKDALNTLNKFEKEYGLSEALMVEKNRIHIRQGHYSEARLEVQKMIKKEPENTSYYILLADLYLEEGQKEKAFEIYKNIEEKEPENGRVHFALSEYYQQKGDKEKAFKEIQKAIVADDINIDLKINLLFTYVRIKNPSPEDKKQVYQLVELLLEKYPNNMKVHSLYSDLLVKDKEFVKARKELLLITEKTPDTYMVWEQLLYIDNQLGDFEALYQHSTKMIDYFPNRAIAYFFSGLAGYQTQRYQEASEYLESGIDLALNDTILLAQIYTMLGDTYHKLKKHSKSDHAYEQAILFNPNNFYVHNNYAYYLSVRDEKLSRAKELMVLCIEAHPNNSTYLDTYAWVLFKQKNYKEALEQIKKAYQNGGRTSAVIVEHYGDILYINDYKSEAIDKWKEAKEIGKGSKWLEQKIKEQKIIED